MSETGVVLYGPPGAGKDTVTTVLRSLRPSYALCERLKAGPGRTVGYRTTSMERIRELAANGDLLYENSRYGATYAVDRAEVTSHFEAGRIPVLHMGQVAGVRAVLKYPASWVTVLLWCSKEVTGERCVSRGDKDVSARLRVWEETRRDVLDSRATWTLTVDSGQHSPGEIAEWIDDAVRTPEMVRARRTDEIAW